VLVSVERGHASVDDLVADDDDLAIAAITAAELLVGVELADDAHREDRARFVRAVLDAVPIELYDMEVAEAHAGLMAETRRSGRPRGAHDLIIAATALARGRTVVTTDDRAFGDLPGVSVRSPSR
jgi:tRNA(fMet)-specific endonuclease VapC